MQVWFIRGIINRSVNIFVLWITITAPIPPNIAVFDAKDFPFSESAETSSAMCPTAKPANVATMRANT